MKTKTEQLNIPAGMRIDIENSDFTTGKIVYRTNETTWDDVNTWVHDKCKLYEFTSYETDGNYLRSYVHLLMISRYFQYKNSNEKKEYWTFRIRKDGLIEIVQEFDGPTAGTIYFDSCDSAKQAMNIMNGLDEYYDVKNFIEKAFLISDK